jgi:hypothetical protein
MFRLLIISLVVFGCAEPAIVGTSSPEQWQRVEDIQTQPAEEFVQLPDVVIPPVVAEVVNPITGSDFYVVKWTAAGCPPCIQWDRSERGKLVAAGIEVVNIDCGNPKNAAKLRQYGVRSWPQFQICRKSTKKSVTRFSGYTTAASLLASIKGHEKPQAAKPVGDIAQDSESLRAWVRSNYRSNQRLSWDVTPRGQVWNHLVEHGFEMGQVRALNQWDALCLHDAVHTERFEL